MKDKKEGYFKRLKTHPGLGFATMFTIMGALAGAQNKSASSVYMGALFGLIVVGVAVWSMVLTSNFKR